MSKPDYDTTIARVAGNILSGTTLQYLVDDYEREEAKRLAVVFAVEMARAVIAEVKRTEPLAALREASRPQEATGKATVYPEVKAPNNWVSAGDQWRDRPPHWPVDRDIIRNHVVENRPREASRLASPPATTEDK